MLQTGENTSPKRRLFLLPGEVHLGMDYFISMFHQNSVHFSALFLEKEEKSSFIPKSLSSFDSSKEILWFTRWQLDLNFHKYPPPNVMTTAL